MRGASSLTRLIPDRQVDGARSVGYPDGPDFVAVFGRIDPARVVQDHGHDGHLFHAGLEVTDEGRVIGGAAMMLLLLAGRQLIGVRRGETLGGNRATSLKTRYRHLIEL